MGRRRKPISIDTTLRNPERMTKFLSVISNYEGEILTQKLTLNIEASFIKEGIYKPTEAVFSTYQKNVKDKKGEFIAEDQSDEAEFKVLKYYDNYKKSDKKNYNYDEIRYLVGNTLQKHKQAKYNYGWSSRFKTHVQILNEFGFCYIELGKKIELSPTGKLLIKYYKNGNRIESKFDESAEHSAYLMGFAKYQISNPWRSNTVELNMLSLFLRTIQYMNTNFQSKGISRGELSLFICWPNNNHVELANYIKQYREKYGFNSSSEKMYPYCMNLMESDAEKIVFQKATDSFMSIKNTDYKPEKIFFETPDEILRKLRESQLVSLRGNGHFVDINHLEDEKIIYIINNINEMKVFSGEHAKQDYFKYMGEIEVGLSFGNDESQEKTRKKVIARDKALRNFAIKMDWDELLEESLITIGKKHSLHPILREINKPTRMEFLVSIVLKKALPSSVVIPNYKFDDEGIPYNTASGGGADIVISDKGLYANVEPTISASRAFQSEHELSLIHI